MVEQWEKVYDVVGLFPKWIANCSNRLKILMLYLGIGGYLQNSALFAETGTYKPVAYK